MSTFAAPLFVNVTVCDCVLPTITLPKDAVEGFSESCPTATAVPTPLRATFAAASDALLETESVALKVPTVFGENEMLIVALCPGATVTGSVGAMREKYWVEIAALLTTSEVLPLFVALKFSVLVLPAGTLPKSRLSGFKERTADCWVADLPAALIPWQPNRTLMPARRKNAVAILES